MSVSVTHVHAFRPWSNAWEVCACGAKQRAGVVHPTPTENADNTFVAKPDSRREQKAEKELQVQFEQWLRLNGYEYMRAPMHKASSLPIGFPDFEIFLPWGCAGFIEFKTETGRLSPEQVAYHARLTERGFKVLVCRRLEEAIAAVREMEGTTPSSKRA